MIAFMPLVPLLVAGLAACMASNPRPMADAMAWQWADAPLTAPHC